MGIQNFPAALQPIIQQGFLEREFEQALKSRLGYRACADRVQNAAIRACLLSNVPNAPRRPST